MDGIIYWNPGLTLEEVEKQVIQKSMSHFKSKAATARALGIALRTLDFKLLKYEAEDKAEKERVENDRRKREEFLARQRGNTPNHVFTGKKETPPNVETNVSGSTPGVRMESASDPAQE